MASIDRTAYPRLPHRLSDEELEAQYGSTDDETVLTLEESLGASARLTFLVMLKTRRQLGYFPLLGDVPEQIIAFLTAALSLPSDTALLDARVKTKTLFRYRGLIHAHLGVRAYGDAGEQLIDPVIRSAALTMSDPADLINLAIETLTRTNVELPDRTQLLPWEECEARLARYCEDVELPTSGGELVVTLRRRLGELAAEVDKGFPDNSELTIDADGAPHLKRQRPKPLPADLQAFQEAVHARMPERHLLDVLKHVHHWVPYTRHFGPPSGSDPKLKDAAKRYLFMVFGFGCNLRPCTPTPRGKASRSSGSPTCSGSSCFRACATGMT